MGKGLIQPVNGQYRIGSSLLMLFSASFIVWQMGVLYFSGTTMSLFGRTPIPLTEEGTAPIIAAGYLCSIVFLCVAPRYAVWAERFLLPMALAATVGMLFPLSPAVITVLFCIQTFCCVFTIATMASMAAQHLTVETTWRDSILSMSVGGGLIALLQNEIWPVSFTTFTLASAVFIAAHTAFYYSIPATIEVSYVSSKIDRSLPKILFWGIWLVSGFATLLLCFASSFAESVPGGVSILYLSAAVMAVPLHLLRRRLGTGAIRVFEVFFALPVFGFVLAMLSLQLPGLGVVACIFLGFVLVMANLWVYFAAVAFRVYPTRFIGVIAGGTGLVLAAFHAGLQSLLRDNLPLLYGLYATLSVALLLVAFFMEPYFRRMWRKDEEATMQSPATSQPCQPEPVEKPAHPFDVLTEQERILAYLILDGHTETSAARQMHISLNTQKGYRKNIYAKLDIHSKRELFNLSSTAP